MAKNYLNRPKYCANCGLLFRDPKEALKDKAYFACPICGLMYPKLIDLGDDL